MDTTKRKFLWALLLFVSLVVKTGYVLAGIKDSPHDIISWYNNQSATGIAGTCAYCHVPHSAKGDRLFPDAISTEQASYGTIGGICVKCHRSAGYGTNSSVVDSEIFTTLDKEKNDSTMDSHPVKGTNKNRQTNTLQNTNLDSAIGAPVPWPWITSGWAGGAKDTTDIECSTCHNPHNWNARAYDSGAQRKFLRAPIYDSAATNGLNNFCVYCHKERQDSARSNSKGTHPISSGGAGVKLDISVKPGLYMDNNKATGYGLFRPFTGSAGLAAGTGVAGTGRSNMAVWDSSGFGGFLGARLAPGDQIICQSCHMPHGVMHSHDDVYQDTGTAELNVGPLLAINNATNLAVGTTKPTNGPSMSDYPAGAAETAYCLDGTHEQNLLCEWCHGMTPDLDTSASALNAFSHPVNKYPSPTNDNMAFESTEYSTLYIKYPPTGWIKYRESSGIRSATDAGKKPVPGSISTNSTLVTANGRNTYLVCLSCHEPHQAWTGTPILKKGAHNSLTGNTDSTFCDGCHENLAMGNNVGTDSLYFKDWTTHPSGPTATLRTSDAEICGVSGTNAMLPNRAGLKTFGVKGGDAEYISCWTCHRVHDSIEPSRAFLADYQTQFSQICVNCHCEGDTDTARVVAASKDAKWKYGATGENVTNANPSKYYIEGAVGTEWWTNKAGKRTGSPARFSFNNLERLGSHYIGQFTGTRLTLTTADTCSWLGERALARVASDATVLLTTIDRSQGSAAGGVSGGVTDKWLDTSSPIFNTSAAWNTWTGGNGSSQASHVGLIGSAKVLICQSCHAVHNSAKGVADDSTISRLLLASNYNSYMCKRCHIPEVRTTETTRTHPMHVDESGGGFTYNTTVGRTGSTVDVYSDKYAYITVYAPANYPYNRMTCDACHSVHNADSKMGAMIVEGNDSASMEKGTGRIESTYSNKVPVMTERNDKPTCDLCHKQGTASE